MEVQLEIGVHCGLSCIHCSSDLQLSREVQWLISATLSAIERGLFGQEVVLVLTGGEPLMLSAEHRNSIADVSRLGAVARIGAFTSGYIRSSKAGLSAKDARNFKLSGLDFSYLSMYSHERQFHEAITGIRGSYDAAMQTLNHLLDAGSEIRLHLVPIRIAHVEPVKYVEMAISAGVSEIRCLRLVKHGLAEQNWGSIGLTDCEQLELIREIQRAAGDRIHVTVAGYPGHFPCRPFGFSQGCGAGRNVVYIDSSGDVFPCACAKRIPSMSLGNVDTLLTRPEETNRRTCLNDDLYGVEVENRNNRTG